MLFYDTFIKMNLFSGQLKKVSTILVGFTGNSINVEGKITLSITIGLKTQQKTLSQFHDSSGPISLQRDTQMTSSK